MRFELPVCPVPKPRQTRSDVWKQRPCVVRYREFADEVRSHGVTVENGDRITFVIETNIRARHGRPHEQRPDIDNLLKALLDATLKEDCRIHTLGALRKVWGESGRIIIERDDP